ncbi:hypothetical protein BKA58DRAFT_462717 [Alternaria rosae]|uniref:uncharacterized protein n=1 Tax=Alternaria rosae TaxID=1187941 RepID=UPI001E8D20E2|nr:uncharacterized protein BKA58DRAFT_462717 [Alternaria rosae]KAH6865127.1 hypothetical protein BKA58DRAFT_462717 [Alternaria rosae]
MLARANSDAGTRLRRSKSASTVHKHAIKQQALAAATAAFARAQAQDAADRNAKRSAELARSKSNASRKSLTSQGSHFPPRDSSFRSLQRPIAEQKRSAQRLSQASADSTEQNTEQFPPFYPTPSVNGSLSIPHENARPSSQPKSFRQSASSSITSQQIRKARSMYYASSVQTGSPIARPPSNPVSEPSPIPLPSRTIRPSPLAGPHMLVTCLHDFQQKSVKHKPSMFLAPFKKRQDKGKDKGKRVASEAQSVSTDYQQRPDESTVDLALSDFVPPHEIKEKRSFSGSLKSKIKKVFRRTSGKSINLPVQQIDASRDYFHTAHFSPPTAKDGLSIPPPNEETLKRIRARTPSLEGAYPAFLRSGSRSNSTGSARSNRTSRVTSWGTTATSDTLTQRAVKRMTVIHESRDSIGSEADRAASMSASRRKSLPHPPLAAFRDPMPMEILTEESLTPVDAKRVFSALMKEIGSSKSQKSSSPAKRTPGAESDVFESSTTKLFSHTRELHSSGSRNLLSIIDSEQRPPSRRPATSQSTQSKTSTIRSFGRAIRSTIRTVTPLGQHSSPDPGPISRVDGAKGVHRREDTMPSPGTTPESDDSQTDSDGVERNCAVQMFTPTASQIEKRVERAKERWKTPLDEAGYLQFPRETDRTYDVATFVQRTGENTKSAVQHEEQVETTSRGIADQYLRRLPVSPRVSVSQASHTAMTPMSPSIYSRNTDGVSILPNDSVMSFGGPGEAERSHDGGSAVVSTSQSIRSFVVGTPSPHRREPTRTSRDWRAWLSHEISGMELTSQEDLRIHDRFTTPSKKVGPDSSRTSHTEHEDTTVVLRGSLDVITPRPYAEDTSDKTEPTVDRVEDLNRCHNDGANVARSDAKQSSSHTGTRDGTHTPLLQIGDPRKLMEHPQPESKFLSNKQHLLPTPEGHASGTLSAFETPELPSRNDRFSFLNTGRRSSSNSLVSPHVESLTNTKSPVRTQTSPKSTPGSKGTNSTSAPATNETTQRVPITTLKRSPARKENVTPPSIRSQKNPAVSPLGLSTRPNSQQLLCTPRRDSPSTNVHTLETPSPKKNASSAEMTTPLRPRIRAILRPMSPEKLARRPRSAFDLRGTNNTGRPTVIDLDNYSPLPGSELRRPALTLKNSTSSLAMSKEPHPETRVSVGRGIESVLDGGREARDGSVTPGQRMAEKFLRQRKSENALSPGGSAGKQSLRGGLVLVREDTPAFL